jgi:hypothetical protein
VEESGEVQDNPAALVQAGNWSYLPAFGTDRVAAAGGGGGACSRSTPVACSLLPLLRLQASPGLRSTQLAAIGCHSFGMCTKLLLPLLSFPVKNKSVEYCAVTLKMILATTSGGHAFGICTLDTLISLPLLPFPVEN